MSRIILLDAGPLGILANPSLSALAFQCRNWADNLLAQGDQLMISEFWAQARQRGKPTAHHLRLDADMILVAQAALLIEDGDEVVIATSNVSHLSLFAPAFKWQDIS
jgi:hypothetical protein